MSSTQLLDRLLGLTALLHDDQERELSRRGLTPARTHVLWEIQHRGPSTQVQLANALGVTPRNITTLVDALVETGFVTRTAHPADRRAVLIELSSRGAKTMTTMVREHRELDDALTDGLDSAALAAAATVLDHAYARLAELVDAHRSATVEAGSPR